MPPRQANKNVFAMDAEDLLVVRRRIGNRYGSDPFVHREDYGSWVISPDYLDWAQRQLRNEDDPDPYLPSMLPVIRNNQLAYPTWNGREMRYTYRDARYNNTNGFYLDSLDNWWSEDLADFRRTIRDLGRHRPTRVRLTWVSALNRA